ncbi:MAG: hypothetical protein OEW11_04175 [Nitrospirota bacterium]|nr:hypothetical protein [Nitrospirota bacterium]
MRGAWLMAACLIAGMALAGCDGLVKTSQVATPGLSAAPVAMSSPYPAHSPVANTFVLKADGSIVTGKGIRLSAVR